MADQKMIKDQHALIITNNSTQPLYQNLLGDGSLFGIKVRYAVQEKPNGIAESLIIGEEFLDGQSCALVLGDNIFFGQGFSTSLLKAAKTFEHATIFTYTVKNPTRFGVVQLDEHENVISIEEKPNQPKSQLAVTGLYFLDKKAVNFAKSISSSKRGELEITDVLSEYMKQGRLKAEQLGRGFAWFDTGTSDALLDAAMFVQTIQRRQGLQIACLEEIALSHAWITKSKLKQRIMSLGKSTYTDYLRELLKGH
ncbi:MAG: sugar nucleotidyltransferase [Aestuariibacter sp.]